MITLQCSLWYLPSFLLLAKFSLLPHDLPGSAASLSNTTPAALATNLAQSGLLLYQYKSHLRQKSEAGISSQANIYKKKSRHD